jgi:hypothetical protein
MGLVVAVAQQRRVLAVRERRIHRRADGKSGDQAPTRDAIDHRELFRDTGWRIVEREAVAHDADGGVGRAPGKCSGDQVG